MKNNILYKRKNRKGFTLAELLMTVAILLIVFALAVPAVFAIQRNLRQKELDSKAEIIYTAVQDKLTELYSKGKSSEYVPNETKGIYSLGGNGDKKDVKPADYVSKNLGTDADGNPIEEEQSFYYFTSDSSFAQSFIDDSTLSADLKEGHWVVEYIPYAAKEPNTAVTHSNTTDTSNKVTSAIVYAVYYSEGDYDITVTSDDSGSHFSYAKTDHSVTDNFLNFYRYKEHRIAKDEADARVGYYGGSTAGSGSETAKFEIISATINSGDEINTAEVKIKNPYTNMNDFKYTFTLKDTSQNEYTILYDNGGFTLADGKTALPDALKKSVKEPIKSGSVYYFVFTLDNLSNEETRFNYLYGKGRTHTESEERTEKNKQLLSGTNITLTVTASSSDKRLNSASNESNPAHGNSLFDYNKKLSSGTDKAFYISNGRHLQNLDSSSFCTDAATSKAYLENDVALGENSKFAEVYKKGKDSDYFNDFTDITKVETQTTVSVPNFKPISNNALYLLTSLDGNTYTISGLTTSGNGLFDNVSGSNGTSGKLDVSNLCLIGERVRTVGNNTIASGLIGTVNNADVSVKNVQIYLDKEKNDIPSTITSDMNMESYRWIAADTTGGLVGVNNGNVTIEDSSVSTVLGKDESVTGGLVGINSGTVSIKNSYTDNYAYGNSVAGMIGENKGSATVNTSYTAGFLGVYDNGKGAGFVTGNKETTVSNSYTVMAAYSIAEDKGLNEISDVDAVNFTYYRTGEKVNNTNVYYLKESKNLSDTEKKDGAIVIGKPDTLANALTGFNTSDKVTVNPYQLLGKSLSNYEYPKLKINHYGDWTADYVPGALVYYEVYKDENGNDSVGFEGANLAVSLISDKDVVGDGYGILYKKDTAEVKPSKVTVSVNGAKATDSNSYMEISIAGSNRKTATVNGVEYDIYPLSKEIVNPDKAISDKYYERVTLTATDENNAVISEKFYDFNPHFARTVREVSKKDSATSTMSNTISIRSPRHLYNLSKFYDDGYRNLTLEKTYLQERNMVYSNYEWTEYTKEKADVTSQGPIGANETTSFASNYDGGCYRIGDVSFVTMSGEYVGMFGYIKGENKFVPSISNVFLLTQYDSDNSQNAYRVEREKAVERNQTLYAGVLVGKNEGNVSNCAVAGYYLSQTNNDKADGTIYGYENSTLYIGGLVGWNEGTIRNSSADNPKLSLQMFKANCYAGGFVGYNFGNGTVNNSYALTSIVSDATDGKTIIAGFAGYNTASISNSYCATALTAQGTGTKAYAFGSNEGNGIESSSYYLSQGSYRFVDKLYAYGRGEMNGAGGTETNTTGMPLTYSQLADRSSLGKAVSSLYNGETYKVDNSATEYPFRAVVTDRASNYVHYGEWTVKPVLGTYGMFYWEHETSGENNGYKFTYVGMVDDSVYTESTLCDAHDDGGIITEYGYGYYVSDDDKLSANVTSNDISGLTEVNDVAKKDLETQVPGIHFYPFTTYTDNSDSNNNKLWLTIGGQNGSVTLTVTRTDTGSSRSLNYTISPFFANAISLNTKNITSVSSTNKGIDDSKADKRFINTNPGFGTNNYEIRSAQQLQYINWNSYKKSTSSPVSEEWNIYTSYNYLMYTSNTGTVKQNKEDAGRYNDVKDIVFAQSHDLNAKDVKNYVPIACPTTSSTKGGYDAVLYTWFGSTFNGQSYKIQELNISSDGFAVGLFGVTVGADLKNIIMYSSSTENRAVIERKTESTSKAGAYSLGGLVGVAYDYNVNPVGRTITNCSIAGYIIRDESKNQLTLGEANVGGLIGVSNVNVDRCSAVVDINENASHLLGNNVNDGITIALYGNYIRVGGLCGAVQNKVTRSYTGGNITVGDTLLQETYHTKNAAAYTGTEHVDYGSSARYNSASYEGSSHVFISGIAGSGFTMNYRNFSGESGSKDGKPTVENCYTYLNFPTMEGTIRSISMIASVADRYGKWGEALATIKNSYYLESSAKLNYNLPWYYFSGQNDGSNSPARLYNWNNEKGKTSFDKLKDGDVRILYQIFSNVDGGVNRKVSIENESSISYSNLSAGEKEKLSGINLLNNGLSSNSQKWGFVTTTDNKGTVNGKYSFNAGTAKLEGKNYPFPTIVTQDSTINVHYGEWPTNGPYWANGNDTIDLISDLNDGVVQKEFTIEKANGDKNDLSGIQPEFEFDDDYVSSVSLINSAPENNRYNVLIKAKKTGSTTVKAIWYKDGSVIEEADFTLTVTCNFTVDVDDPNDRTLQLGTDFEKTVKLVAKEDNNDIDTSNNFKWEASVSQTLIKGQNDADADIGTTSDDHKTYLKITGHGNDATITVKGIYTYLGNSYESSVRILVRKLNFVGISDNSKYLENVIGSDAGQKDTTFSADNKPDFTGSSYYLYEYKDSNLISNDNTVLTLLNDGNEVTGSKVTLGTKVTFGNYDYYPIVIDTSDVDPLLFEDDLRSATIQATITNEGKEYNLSLDGIYAELPHLIHFTDVTGELEVPIADDVKVTDSVNKLEIALNNAINHEGYVIEGWYADSSDTDRVKILEADGTVVSGNVSGYVTNGKLTLSTHSVTLHPVWRRYVATKADMSALDENGQYMLVYSGTSMFATKNNKDRASFFNLKMTDENTFTFTDIGQGTNTYALTDYLYKANEIPSVTSDVAYQITEEQIYRYVQPSSQSEADESNSVINEQ